MAPIRVSVEVSTMHIVGVVHVHSDYSRDGKDPLSRLREFALERGIAFVALTDHAEDFVSELFDEYVAECASLSDDRVRLIPGLEFRFAKHRGLHLLAMGLTRLIAPETPDAFAAEAPDAARFTAMAHPVLARYVLPESVAARIDAIEVWNASYNTRYLPDPRAIALL
ncbi:MAG: PHP domain-containing protein, partial [Gemmatimonadota bacterium]|nr:PHP domain-containing protein [Gemmatimonadota bacterium]